MICPERGGWIVKTTQILLSAPLLLISMQLYYRFKFRHSLSSRNNIVTISIMMLSSNVMLTLLRVFVDLKYSLAEVGNNSFPGMMVIVGLFTPAFLMTAWAFNYD